MVKYEGGMMIVWPPRVDIGKIWSVVMLQVYSCLLKCLSTCIVNVRLFTPSLFLELFSTFTLPLHHPISLLQMRGVKRNRLLSRSTAYILRATAPICTENVNWVESYSTVIFSQCNRRVLWEIPVKTGSSETLREEQFRWVLNKKHNFSINRMNQGSDVPEKIVKILHAVFLGRERSTIRWIQKYICIVEDLELQYIGVNLSMEILSQ